MLLFPLEHFIRGTILADRCRFLRIRGMYDNGVFKLFYPMDNFNRGRLSVLDAYPALFLSIFDAVHCNFIHYNI